MPGSLSARHFYSYYQNLFPHDVGNAVRIILQWWSIRTQIRTVFTLLQGYSGVFSRGQIKADVEFGRPIGTVIHIYRVDQHIYDVSAELRVVDVSLGELGEPIDHHLPI